MGICDSSNNEDKNINQNINPNNNIKPKKILAIENDATGIFARYNIDTDNIDLYKKNHNGYILPVSLARSSKLSR